ncbi:MAG: hypothetical protein QXU69_10985 [Thermofilaceae archaeon]
MPQRRECKFSSFELTNLSVHRKSGSTWFLKIEIRVPQPYPDLSLYVELYDCEENIVAVAYLDDVKVEGSNTIIEIPLLRVDSLSKARVTLTSNREELWTVEAGINAHNY